MRDTTSPQAPRYEETQRDAMFSNEVIAELTEWQHRVKMNKAITAMISANERLTDLINDQKNRIEKLEKQVEHLSKLVDPEYWL